MPSADPAEFGREFRRHAQSPCADPSRALSTARRKSQSDAMIRAMSNAVSASSRWSRSRRRSASSAGPPHRRRLPAARRRAAAAPLVAAGRRSTCRNVKQLTFGAENAEAYFSFDGKRLTFQSTKDKGCDQIYSMNIDGTDVRCVSSGDGRTTCSFYTPDGKSIVYASTHLGGARLSAGARARAGLRLADLRHLRHLQDQRRRHGPDAPDEHAGLRRRGHDRQGRPHRLHERARRRHGDLHDERRRLRRAAAHAAARAGRRAVLLGRRVEDRLPRPAPAAGHGARRLLRAAEEGHLAAGGARRLRDESRRQQPDAGDEERRRRELGAVLRARRQADHLRVEHEGSARRQLRSLSRSTSTAPDSSR